MNQEFDIEEIRIRDLATGAGFTFQIKDRKLHRPSIEQRPLPSNIAPEPLDLALIDRATAFALRVARTWGHVIEEPAPGGTGRLAPKPRRRSRSWSTHRPAAPL